MTGGRQQEPWPICRHQQWLSLNHWRLPKVAEEVGRMVNSFLSANVFFDRGIQPPAGVINLVTRIRAKGLEWDTVYVVSVTSNDYRPANR